MEPLLISNWTRRSITKSAVGRKGEEEEKEGIEMGIEGKKEGRGSCMYEEEERKNRRINEIGSRFKVGEVRHQSMELKLRGQTSWN